MKRLLWAFGFFLILIMLVGASPTTNFSINQIDPSDTDWAAEGQLQMTTIDGLLKTRTITTSDPQLTLRQDGSGDLLLLKKTTNNKFQVENDGDTNIFANILRLGDNTDQTYYFYVDNGDANNPAIRYYHTGSTWQFADDGTTWETFASTTDLHTQNTDTGTTGTSFTIGNNTDQIYYIYADISGSSNPNIRYNPTGSTWQISHNGTSWDNMDMGATHAQNTDTGTSSNTFNLGDGTTGSNKIVYAYNGDANLPGLRYNETLNQWEYTNNGTTWNAIGGGGGGGTVTSVATGNGLTGGPITTTGTVDLLLNSSGGLSKTLGGGSNELGIASGGVTNAMLAGSITSAKLVDGANIHTQNTDVGSTANTWIVNSDGGVAKLTIDPSAYTSAYTLNKTKTDGWDSASTHVSSDGSSHSDVVLNNSHRVNTSNPHSVTKSQVLTGNLIVNADVDASAAIATSKLADGSKIHDQGTDQGTTNNSFSIGPNTTASNKIIYADNGDTNEPKIQYNETANQWEYCNDGVSCGAIGGGGGSGTVTSVGTGNGLTGGPITASGTIDLNLNSGGGLSKTLGGGSDELGIASSGVTNDMLAGSITSAKLVDGSKFHTQNTDTGSTANSFQVGDGADTTKTFYVANGDANKPGFRYYSTGNKWQYTNNGTDWNDIGPGMDASTVQYSILVANAGGGWNEDTGFKVNTGAVTTGSWTATAIASGYGGTGLTSFSQYSLLYASAGDTWAELATTATRVLATNGSGVPAWSDSITLGNTGLTIGSSIPFSDSTGTLTLQNVDALDSTTETTIETAIDTLGTISVTQVTTGNTGLIVGASTPFSDASGTLTLQNIDALDSTTETTIENAIDTLGTISVTQVTTGNTGLIVGASTPFSDSGGTLTLQNIDAIDATTETTIEGAIDSLGSISTIDLNGGTIDGISSLTSSGDLDIGAHDFQAATLSADTLTTGRLVVVGSDGLLSDATVTESSGALGGITTISMSGNLTLSSGGTIQSTSNGNILIDPNGSGYINFVHGATQYTTMLTGTNSVSGGTGVYLGGTYSGGGGISSLLIDSTVSASSTAYDGIYIASTISGGTTTTHRGIIITDPTGAGTITNNYGLYIEHQTKGGTVNWDIYGSGGLSIGTSANNDIVLNPGGTGVNKLQSNTIYFGGGTDADVKLVADLSTTDTYILWDESLDTWVASSDGSTEVPIANNTRFYTIPASAFICPSSGGAEQTTSSDTNWPVTVNKYDADSDEVCRVYFDTPDNLADKNVTAIIKWKAAATANEVMWVVTYRTVSDGDAWDTAGTDAAYTADTAKGTANQLNTASKTITDPFDASDTIEIKVSRDADNGSDDMTGDAEFVSLTLKVEALGL